MPLPTKSIRPIHLNLLDRVIMQVSPKFGLERVKYRAFANSLQDQGLITAGSSKPSMRGWNPSANTPDTDIIPKLDSLRATSRDLFMNTPIATGALRRDRTNVIGFGLRLQSQIDREYLGLNDEEATQWERNTEREFFSWANNIECDAARTLTFNQLTSLAYFSASLSGDVFVLLPRIPRRGQVYDMRVKLIEADYCSNPMMQFDTVRIAGGVEVDDDSAPIAYHFRKLSMNSMLGFPVSAADKWERIPAYGPNSGRRQVLHLFEKERPGQRRGVPMLAPVVEELKSLTRLSKAELQAAIINAFFTVFIKTTTPAVSPMEGGFIPAAPGYPSGAPGVSMLNPSDDRDSRTYEMGAGNVIEMEDDQSVDVADPKRPNQLFEPFFIAIVKQIGSALNLPFELLMLHFSASYSASRAALQEAWKHFRERRLWAATYFCQPVYVEFLTEAILKGRISAPGFFSDPVIRDAWTGSSWAGPGQGQLDPLKETKASVLKVQNKLSTHEDEFVAMNGGDWEGAMTRLSREKTFLEELGLETEMDEQEPGTDEPDVSEQVEEAVNS